MKPSRLPLFFTAGMVAAVLQVGDAAKVRKLGLDKWIAQRERIGLPSG